jgi:hypothetical protein
MNWHLWIPFISYGIPKVLKVFFPKNKKLKELAPLIGTAVGVLGGLGGQEYFDGGIDSTMTGIDAFLGMSAAGMHEHGEMVRRTRGRMRDEG